MMLIQQIKKYWGTLKVYWGLLELEISFKRYWFHKARLHKMKLGKYLYLPFFSIDEVRHRSRGYSGKEARLLIREERELLKRIRINIEDFDSEPTN